MRATRRGGLELRITGGTDDSGGGDGPVVVLMHGFGAPGLDLVPLSRELEVPEGTRFVFPQGPIALNTGIPGGGRAWWMIDIERFQHAVLTGRVESLTRSVPEGLAAARELLNAMLDELPEELGKTASPLVLGGFSQGAMLACDVALRSERKLAGLVMLSGTIVARDDWLSAMLARTDLPVFQSHGSWDPILPFSVAQELRAAWLSVGAPHDWVPFDGGHAIAASVVDRLGSFLTRALAESS